MLSNLVFLCVVLGWWGGFYSIPFPSYLQNPRVSTSIYARKKERKFKAGCDSVESFSCALPMRIKISVTQTYVPVHLVHGTPPLYAYSLSIFPLFLLLIQRTISIAEEAFFWRSNVPLRTRTVFSHCCARSQRVLPEQETLTTAVARARARPFLLFFSTPRALLYGGCGTNRVVQIQISPQWPYFVIPSPFPLRRLQVEPNLSFDNP